MLGEFSAATVDAADYEQRLMQTLMDEATQLVGAQFGVLYMGRGDPQASAFELCASAGVASATLPGHCELAWIEASSGGPAALAAEAGPLRLPSTLWVPLRTEPSHTSGVIIFAHNEPNFFSARDAQVARSVGRQISVTCENARLVAQSAQTQAHLRRELEFSGAVASSIAEGVLVFDSHGVITFQNPAASELLGVNAHTLVGTPVHAVWECEHAQDEPQLCPFLAVLRTGEAVRNQEGWLRRANGTAFPAACSVAPIVGADRSVTAAVFAFRDVGAHKAAQETLMFQKSLLESQTEASIDGILVVSNNGNVLLYNSRFMSLWRLRPEHLQRRSDAELLQTVHDKIVDPDEFRARVAYLYQHPDESSHEEVELKDARIFDRYSAPIKSENGVRHGRVWFFRDITDAVTARQQVEALVADLSKQQQWLEAVLDLLPVPVLLLDAATVTILFANRAADHYAGGVFPKICLQLHTAGHEALISTFGEPAQRASEGETLTGHQTTWSTPDGEKTLLLHSKFLPARDGHRDTVVIAFDDVSPLKRVEAELQGAVRVRDEFLSIASHELKTPVTALHLQIQSVLRRRSKETSTPEWMMGKILRAETQVERLIRLINNLLDVSRITAGRLEFEPEDVDLAQVVREAADRFRDEIARAGSELHVHADETVWGFWDRLRLEQVVTNLLTNAIKYGKGQPIELTVEGIDGVARLQVKDHGIGISHENQARIFERFERAVSERQYGGLGLGLWITRQIVEALSGIIRVVSEPDAGSLFIVELPRQEAPAPLS